MCIRDRGIIDYKIILSKRLSSRTSSAFIRRGTKSLLVIAKCCASYNLRHKIHYLIDPNPYLFSTGSSLPHPPTERLAESKHE